MEISASDLVINVAAPVGAFSRGSHVSETLRERLNEIDRRFYDGFPRKLAMVAADDEDEAAAGALVDVLQQLKADRTIVGVGIRSADWRVAKRLVDSMEVDFLQLGGGSTVLRRSSEAELFVAGLARQDIGVVAAGVFQGGFLTGGSRLDGRELSEANAADRSLLAWRKAFTSLCHGHGVRPANACIQFVLSLPGVTAVSLSTSHVERVAENVEAASTTAPEALWESMREEGLLTAR